MNAKEKIVEVAQKLFVNQGYQGTSVREISSQADVNISAISYYFSGKKGLYEACIQEFGKEALEYCSTELLPADTKEDFAKCLTNYTGKILDLYAMKPDLVRLVVKEVEDSNILGRKPGEGAVQDMFFHLIQYIDDAKAKNILSESFDSKIMASIVFANVLQGVCYDGLRAQLFSTSLQDEEFRNKYKEHISKFYLHGILLAN